MRRQILASTSAIALLLGAGSAYAGMDEAKAFLDKEVGDLSTLSRADQEAEMQWFVDAAKPFAGMEIKVVSETITTHEYESKVLAPAFTAITGIKITHDLIGEGDVVEKLQTQMQSGENIYDAYVNDSDLIGTHWRYQQARSLTKWMANEGKDVTDPNLDLADFIGTKFTTAPDGDLYQLPDQQFANLYWFRYDWFNDEKNKADFKAKYGYDLGVPVNWSAYEDIAEFFTGREIDGKKVYGHMDYGKKDPSLGWRFTDAWLSMAGNGDKGLPNGLPVDEWGIKVNEKSQPVGSCVARGGDTNGPAAVYSIEKYLAWLKAYAPPEAQGMTFSESGPVPAQGAIAQQMFWYTAFTADMVKKGLPVMNDDGTPKWRMAPSPHGVYWKDGMKLGYQDVGSWTLAEVHSRRSRQGRMALRAVRRIEDGRREEEPCRPDLDPRKLDPARKLHRARTGARRADRVLSFAGPRPVVADRNQRAGLSEAGAALVAGDRRCVVGRQDPAGGDGLALCGAGKGAGTPGKGRHPGRHRPEDGRGARSCLLERRGGQGRQPCAPAEGREREGKAGHDQLRRAGQELEQVSFRLLL